MSRSTQSMTDSEMSATKKFKIGEQKKEMKIQSYNMKQSLPKQSNCDY
jgi:hypothetical protein